MVNTNVSIGTNFERSRRRASKGLAMALAGAGLTTLTVLGAAGAMLQPNARQDMAGAVPEQDVPAATQPDTTPRPSAAMALRLGS